MEVVAKVIAINAIFDKYLERWGNFITFFSGKNPDVACVREME